MAIISPISFDGSGNCLEVPYPCFSEGCETVCSVFCKDCSTSPCINQAGCPLLLDNGVSECISETERCPGESTCIGKPNFGKPFTLHTDASKEGLGAVLEQDGHLHRVATLGVVWAVKHFQAYLYSHKCTVFTDYASLCALLRSAHPSGKLALWAHVLSELDLDICYHPGEKKCKCGCSVQ